MNFSYGIIGIVGVLAAISIGFISMEPNEIIEPRIITVEEKTVACTMQWHPVCGVDGKTYGNQCGLDAAGIELDYSGECLIVQPQPTQTTSIVLIPLGVAVPGCEDTDECYLPYEITVDVDTSVIWSNDDSAAHTVTSSNFNADVTGILDSGLFMAGSTFEFTFTDVGTFEYFCQVHPWMTGLVNVN